MNLHASDGVNSAFKNYDYNMFFLSRFYLYENTIQKLIFNIWLFEYKLKVHGVFLYDNGECLLNGKPILYLSYYLHG